MARTTSRWLLALAALLLLAGLFGFALLMLGEKDAATVGALPLPDRRAHPRSGDATPPPAPAPVELAAAPAEAPPASVDPTAPWRLQVLGPNDVPLAGVVLEPSPLLEAWKDTSTITGPDGLADVPWAVDEEPPVTVHLSGVVGRRMVEVDAPLTTVRYPDLVPLEVAVVDGWTGDAVWGAAVRLGSNDEAPAVTTRGAPEELGLGPLERGEEADLTIHVTPPDGWTVYGTGSQHFQGTVSRYAERVRVTAVVWPAVPLLARVTHADGSPAADVHVSARWPQVGNTTGPGRRSWRKNVRIDGATATTDPVGRARIRGVPAVPGEFVAVTASTEDRWVTTAPVRIDAPDLPIEIAVELPREPVGLGGGAGGGTGTRFSCGRPKPTATPVGDGTLVLDVLRHDGTPAANTGVTLQGAVPGGTGWKTSGRTDADGRIRFEHLPGGTASLSVTEPGFVLAGHHAVDIAPTGETTHRLSELPGMTVTVRVLDDRGDPAPAARLTVQGAGGAWAPVDGQGVQHLAPLTGPTGRVRLDRVHPGVVTITARLGTRTAMIQGDTGGEIEVRLPSAVSE